MTEDKSTEEKLKLCEELIREFAYTGYAGPIRVTGEELGLYIHKTAWKAFIEIFGKTP